MIKHLHSKYCRILNKNLLQTVEQNPLKFEVPVFQIHCENSSHYYIIYFGDGFNLNLKEMYQKNVSTGKIRSILRLQQNQNKNVEKHLGELLEKKKKFFTFQVTAQKKSSEIDEEIMNQLSSLAPKKLF